MATYEEQETFTAARMGGIGGSDVAAILGLSPFRKPIDVWESKVYPEQVPELEKECIYFGNALEPVIRGAYAMRHQVEVIAPDQLGTFFPTSRAWNGQTIVTGSEPWMLGTADGWIPSRKMGLEIKNVGRKDEMWGDFGTDEIPAHYVTQCAWYIDVHNADGWQVAPLFSGNALGYYHVRRDDELLKEMRDAVRDFWHTYVVPRREPPVDSSESYGRYLARKFSMPSGRELANPPGNVISLAVQLRDAQAEANRADESVQYAKNQMAAVMSDFDKARTPVGTIGWVRRAAGTQTDWKASAIELGSLYDDARSQTAKSAQDVMDGHTKPTQASGFVRGWWKK